MAPGPADAARSASFSGRPPAGAVDAAPIVGAGAATLGARSSPDAGAGPTGWVIAWSLSTDPDRCEPVRPERRDARDGLKPRRTRKNPGDDLFSRKAALSVSSALESLTSVFGMGTGMASPPVSPGFVASGCCSAATSANPTTGHGGAVLQSIFEISRQDVVDPRFPATDPRSVAVEVKPSTVSTAQLHPSPNFHMRPIKQVVSLRSYPVDPVGNLISRRASHLDAFSAYPDRT